MTSSAVASNRASAIPVLLSDMGYQLLLSTEPSNVSTVSLQKFTSVAEMPSPSRNLAKGASFQKQASLKERPMGQQADVEPAAPDPWASLQSQYQMKDSDRTSELSSSGRVTVGAKGSKRGKGANGGVGSDEVHMFDDGEGGLRQLGVNTGAKARANGRAKLPPISGVTSGGWGKGSMAAAGTLMLGDEDDIIAGKTPGSLNRNVDTAGPEDIQPDFNSAPPKHRS
eukprot:gene11670-34389_t